MAASTSVEILILGEESNTGLATLDAAAKGAAQAGLSVTVTQRYSGDCDWLCIFGAGELKRNAARKLHIASGRHVALWDLGYFGRSKDAAKTYVRVSIDHFHPQAYIGDTPPEPSRWDAQRIALREDWNPSGHVVVVGMGPKSRTMLDLYDWEMRALNDAKMRFPNRRILYRPKRDKVPLKWEQDATSQIEQVLRGACIAICRHSNVAVDACIAGVLVECEDGAAYWLYSRNKVSPSGSGITLHFVPTVEQRLDFLRRLSWWQWRLSEMPEAWSFLTKVCGSTSAADATRLTVG